MNVLLYVILIVIALMSASVSVWYQKAYITNSRPQFIPSLKENKILMIIMSVCFIAMIFLGTAKMNNDTLRTDNVIQNLLIWYGVSAAAVIDYKVKKIPNALILTLLAVRTVFIMLGGFFSHDSLKFTLLRSLFGMILGGGIILICMFFSKGGIGAGDMKLYAVIGFCFGITGLVQVMIYSMFFSAVICIGLLIFKKAKMRSTVPMAPFILAGLTVYYLFL